MLLDILVIFFAWFIDMPLWLSILATCFGVLWLVVDLVKIGIKIQKKFDERENN